MRIERERMEGANRVKEWRKTSGIDGLVVMDWLVT